MWKAKESPPMTTDELLGISEPLTEEYVTRMLRAFNQGS